MPKAICENCGSLVEAELTHNGVCVVGHYVHCGWGHELSPDDLISGDVADRIEELETKLAKAVEALERIEDASKYFGNCPEATETTVRYAHETTRRLCRTTLAELKGQDDETP